MPNDELLPEKMSIKQLFLAKNELIRAAKDCNSETELADIVEKLANIRAAIDRAGIRAAIGGRRRNRN